MAHCRWELQNFGGKSLDEQVFELQKPPEANVTKLYLTSSPELEQNGLERLCRTRFFRLDQYLKVRVEPFKVGS